MSYDNFYENSVCLLRSSLIIKKLDIEKSLSILKNKESTFAMDHKKAILLYDKLLTCLRENI